MRRLLMFTYLSWFIIAIVNITIYLIWCFSSLSQKISSDWERNTRQTEAVPLLFQILGTMHQKSHFFPSKHQDPPWNWDGESTWLKLLNGNWKCCFNSKFNKFKRCNILTTLWIISNIQSSNRCDIFKKFLYQSSGGNWESKCRTSNLLIPKFFHREDLDSLHCTTCSWLLWKRGNTFCKLMQILFEKNTNTFCNL